MNDLNAQLRHQQEITYANWIAVPEEEYAAGRAAWHQHVKETVANFLKNSGTQWIGEDIVDHTVFRDEFRKLKTRISENDAVSMLRGLGFTLSEPAIIQGEYRVIWIHSSWESGIDGDPVERFRERIAATCTSDSL